MTLLSMCGEQEGKMKGRNLEADPRRGGRGNSLQLLQRLLALRADVLQNTPLRLPLEVVVHHLVQRLVVVPVVNPAFEASQLAAVSGEEDIAGPPLAHGAPPHAHFL